jgi:uncharacterized LabA/DUF88 family protein
MARVSVFVDGFNMYHALEGDVSSRQQGKYRRYKWLDYAKLAHCFVGSQDTMVKIRLFTSLATWDADKANRHSRYLHVLRQRGIEVVFGKFKRRDRLCQVCHRPYSTFEEKLTDVNLAVHLFRGAVLDEYDKALIISGDTDSIPAIRAIRELFPVKTVGVVLPIGRRSEELKQETDFHFRMKERHLARSQLPDEIQDPVHGVVRRPETWK